MKKLIILLAMCTGGYAMAQNNSSNWTADNDASAFIKKAAMIDKKEIKAGKMAKEKAMNPQVRSYGEMMVTSHTNSSAELRSLASKKNIMLPSDDHSMNKGASTGSYMGTEGQSSYSGISTSSDWKSAGTISARSYRGTANMKLSKAQTTPNRKYINGTPTYWTDKDVVSRTSSATTTWKDNSGTSTSNSATSGQNMTSGTVNTGNTYNSSTVDNTPPTTSTMEEPGVSSAGNLGISGTTGTLKTNAAFNGALTYPEHTGIGTGTTTQSMATGTSTLNNDLPTADDDPQQKLEMLGQKTGAEFDRAYMDMMVAGHSKAIQLYENASKSSDTDVSAFASKMLPVLKQHHEQARSLKATVDSNNSGL